MIRALTLAVLSLAITTQAAAASVGPRVTVAGPGEVGLLGPVVAAGHSRLGFKTAGQVAWYPFTTPGELPACVASDGCVMRCYVESGAWYCEEPDGTSIPVQNASAPGTATCFYDKECIGPITDSNAPYILNADVPGGIDFTGPLTFVVTGYSTKAYSTAPVHLAYGHFRDSGLYIQSGACYWSTSGTNRTVSSGASDIIGSYSTVWCIRAGDVGHTVRARFGQIEATSAASFTPANTTKNFYFGRYPLAGYATGGYLHSVYVWNAALSSSAMGTFERVLYGSMGTQPVTWTRASTTWAEQSDGQWLAYGQYAPTVTDGAEVGEQRTNLVDYSLDASAWALNNAPTITTDTDSGPFATYNVGAEADTIVDDDASLYEGIYFDYASPPTATYTGSVWVKADASGKMRILLYGIGGVGLVPCDFTGVSSSAFERKECQITLTGGETTLRFYVLPGNVGSDTGSIVVSGMQLEQSSYATPPCLSEGAATTCNADVVTVPTDGWPTVQGEVALTITPYYVTSGGAMPNTVYLVDTRTGGSVGWLLYGSSVLVGYLDTAYLSVSQSWQESVATRVSMRWGPVTSFLSIDGVVVKSGATTDPVTVIGSTATIGGRNFSQPFGKSVRIKNLEIRR